jgi:uncharacterized membrane protein
MRILIQISMAFLVFSISKHLSDTHFSGSVAGVFVMFLNDIINQGMKD